MLLEQCGGRDQHPGRTCAALRRSMLQKCFLQPIEQGRAPGQALDRRDFVTFRLSYRHQARAHRFAVEQHGARPAVTRIAADLRTGEAQVFPQHTRQPLAW